MQKTNLDEMDRRILRVLSQDGRASFQEVGKQVGLSPSPCWQRIKRMEESGVIQGYAARIDVAELGFRDSLIVMLTLEQHSDEMLERFERALADIPEVIEAYLVSGEHDYFIRVAVKDTRDYERLLREKLYKIAGLRHSVSSFVLRQLKAASVPL
ncbi:MULTISPECIES: Lrp/AsnC family transcriptional regulator [Pseudomonas]|uniref:Lrp/AsnC family transcriptional regulator n=1 Tax=Pseudomonas TaxID=286 RepID=UPI000D4921CE|nr:MULTISPECIES: Lrp/AsnC family transcriptional regulator [Pseudomonas]PTC01785.1 AsnC family transcriptional regulator [Thalassospira xiamenensis]ELF6204311.1 Lrp/AsnC family transcriptional regulator [Pseudomonas putida]MCE0881713.1 Lrp/AsnC family transcriptional regulator [Pseudomonas putida]MCE0966976.1 Lrp/AsnC family transcriptional regulator [Pseudomonas sp. NMI4491_12]MDO1496920.1 Lrp/AsnC family transcriptional regulator [Pseudomonas putida]